MQTLVLTDIASGWTECAPLLVREQHLLIEVLGELRKLLPFPLLGFDTDNDSVFINETVHDYCQAEGIAFTRCRPYRKNDQAWIEQKNGAVVRRIVGYRRFEGLEAAAALAQLYKTTRLFVNFFQPSFKLAGKERDGARVKKKYHRPATPCQRLLADPRTSAEVRQRLEAMQASLDPVSLLHEMRMAQQRFVEIADAPVKEDNGCDQCTPLEASSPDCACVARRRRASDSEAEGQGHAFAAAAGSVGCGRFRNSRWFDAEPWRTGRELLERLQQVYPGIYPDGLLRTLQRRLKAWRGEMARKMVFGTGDGADAKESNTSPPPGS